MATIATNSAAIIATGVAMADVPALGLLVSATGEGGGAAVQSGAQRWVEVAYTTLPEQSLQGKGIGYLISNLYLYI